MIDHRAIVDRLQGPLVPVLPAFTDDQTLDLASTCRWLERIVAAGVPMFWLTPGTSRYGALSDQEVWELTAAVASVTRGRSLLIAATNGHWPLRQCRRYVDHCVDVGADIVKVCPQSGLGAGDEATFDFFHAMAADAPLPLFAYTLPRPGGGHLVSTATLARLCDLPAYVGMKNDSGDFYEHRAYLWTIRSKGARFVPMTGGSMMSFLWGHDFGAQAFCAAYGIVAPHVALDFHRHLVAGRREQALALVHEHEEPFLAEISPLGGWQALRPALVAQGLFESRQDRFPFPTLGDEAAERVVAHLRAKAVVA